MRIFGTQGLFIFVLATVRLACAQGVDSILLLNQTPPAAIAADRQGNLLVAQPIAPGGPIGVYRYTPQGGLIEAFTDAGQTIPATASVVLAVDPQGAIYLGGYSGLVRIGGPTWSPELPADPIYIDAIAFDSESNPILLFLVPDSASPNQGDARILKLDRVSGRALAAFDLADVYSPQALAVDSAGAIYVAGYPLYGFVAKLDSTLQQQVYRVSLDTALPTSLALDSAGNLYISETPFFFHPLIPGGGGGLFQYGDYAVYKLDPTGVIVASNSGGGSSLALDAVGNPVVVGGNYPPTGAFQTTCGPRTDLGGLSITTLDGATLEPRNSAMLAQQVFRGSSALLPDGSLYLLTTSGRVLHANPGAASSPVSCIVNGANYLAETNIAPGQLLTIFGKGLGADPLTVYDEAQQLPFASNGTEVRIGGYSAPLLAVSSTQINANVPYEISQLDPTQPVPVEIVRNGRTIYTWPMNPVSQNPAVLTASPLEIFKAPAYQDFVDTEPVPLANVLNADGTVNSVSNPAHLGSTVTIFASGFGQLSPGALDGAPGVGAAQQPAAGGLMLLTGDGDLTLSVSTIPGRTNAVVQMNVTIPANFATGSLPFLIGPPAMKTRAWTNFLYLAQ